jgi:hypothetical protein
VVRRTENLVSHKAVSNVRSTAKLQFFHVSRYCFFVLLLIHLCNIQATQVTDLQLVQPVW